jgi:hypothetical protein
MLQAVVLLLSLEGFSNFTFSSLSTFPLPWVSMYAHIVMHIFMFIVVGTVSTTTNITILLLLLLLLLLLPLRNGSAYSLKSNTLI